MHEIEGLSEEEITKVINSIVDYLAPSNVFGYYTLEDIKQEGWINAMEALPRFIADKGMASPERNTLSDRLYNFLRTHVQRRYHNLLRNNMERIEPPNCECSYCINGESDKCERYQKFIKRNTAKRLIAQAAPQPLTTHEAYSPSHTEAIETAEIIKLMNEHLPAYLRADFKRMLEQISVPATRREKIRNILRNVVESGIL